MVNTMDFRTRYLILEMAKNLGKSNKRTVV